MWLTFPPAPMQVTRMFADNGLPLTLPAQLGRELPECELRVITCKGDCGRGVVQGCVCTFIYFSLHTLQVLDCKKGAGQQGSTKLSRSDPRHWTLEVSIYEGSICASTHVNTCHALSFSRGVTLYYCLHPVSIQRTRMSTRQHLHVTHPSSQPDIHQH